MDWGVHRSTRRVGHPGLYRRDRRTLTGYLRSHLRRLECLDVGSITRATRPKKSVISKDNGRVTVRVMQTDEESEIARSVSERLGKPKQ